MTKNTEPEVPYIPSIPSVPDIAPVNTVQEQGTGDIEVIKGLLKMFNPEHGIIISNDIGLIGNNDFKISPFREYDGTIYDANLDKPNKFRLGDKYKVLHSDGFVLFDEEVEWTGIIKGENNENVAYIFGLYGRGISNTIDSFFGDDCTDSSLVLYTPSKFKAFGGKCETNDKELSEVSNEYIYKENMSYNKTTGNLVIDNKAYRMIEIDSENKIYRIYKR